MSLTVIQIKVLYSNPDELQKAKHAAELRDMQQEMLRVQVGRGIASRAVA